MSALDLSAMADRLQAELAELRAVAEQARDSAAVVELDQTRVGRLSRMDAMQAQAMSSASNARRLERIKDVEAALARIADSEYGECAECGEAINPRRLDVDPAAALCIECAERRG